MSFFPISPIPQAGGNFILSMQTYVFSWCVLSPTKVMVAYCQDNPIKLYVQIVNFNGSNAPTMGPATYVADLQGATANLPGVVIKLTAFDETTVGLMWNPTTANPGNYNLSVLNVDVSDNISWNIPTFFSSYNAGYSTNQFSFRNIDSTNATIMGYSTASSGTIVPYKVTRTGNTLAAVPQTGLGTGAVVNTFSKRLPSTGIAHFSCNATGVSPIIYFTNALSALASISGLTTDYGGIAANYGGVPVISAVSNNLLHYFRSVAGTIFARPLNLNLTTTTSTGNWVAPEQVYNIVGWPAGSPLDVVQIDSEYFMIIGSPQVMTNPAAFTPITYSFVVGRYLSATASYTFAPIQTPVTAQGLPMWGYKHLHVIDSSNVACFTIQGTSTNRVFGVKLLHL